MDVNGDGIFEPGENLVAAAPYTLLIARDGVRQTVVDLMQLVRVIQVGVDVDGDGIFHQLGKQENATLDLHEDVYLSRSM